MSEKKEKVSKLAVFIDSIFATIFILLFMLSLQLLLQKVNLEGLDAIGQALDDMEITDYAFSTVREDSVSADPNIVIINIGPLDRSGIADQIRIADKFGAKVIGVDSFFKGYNGDTLGSYNLANAIANARAEVVMVAKVDQSDSLVGIEEATELYDHIYISDSMFIQNTHLAMANLDTDADNQDDVKICRAFPPTRTLISGGEAYIAFGAKMAQLYDSSKIDKLLERENEYEVINFRGDVLLSPNYVDYTNFTLGSRVVDDKYMCFEVLDYDQVLAEDFVPEMIKDRIVLIGYLGERLGAPEWEDKFFTPLNNKIAGRANPDMYGPVIHANIAAMVLNGDYVDGFEESTENILGILLLFINVLLFSIIYHTMDAWYDGITKLIQLVEIIALTFVVVVVFSSYNFKMELAIAFFGIALVGDLLEIYYGVIKNIINRKKLEKLLTLVRKSG